MSDDRASGMRHARLQGSTPLGLGNSSQLRSVAVSKASRCIMEQKPSYEFKSPSIDQPVIQHD